MIAALVLAGYAVLVAAAAPRLLARAAWPHRAPVAAVTLWLALAFSFVAAVLLALVHLAVPIDSGHGPFGWLSVCGSTLVAHMHSPPSAAAAAFGLSAAAVVLARLLATTVSSIVGAARKRGEHARLLALVACRDQALGVLVLDHGTPAVYCLPGRCPRIVVTSGAMEALTEPQLAAVIAHERAHIAGRHHILIALAEAFDRAFPRLPLARTARAEVELLVEMLADDRAADRHDRHLLATALYEVAAGGAPRPALAAGGPSALARMRRLLRPAETLGLAGRFGAASLSSAAIVLPALLTCVPAVVLCAA